MIQQIAILAVILTGCLILIFKTAESYIQKKIKYLELQLELKNSK